MRIANLVFAAALAASAALAPPALAKNSTAQKAEDKSAPSSTCSAYQQAPDGSWEPLPCRESGERAPPQTQHKSGPHGTDQGER
ncbi:hypothetical protein QRQ56_08160 [Bradyrhizobium sp. U531]|uniref:hypothetical protein n=1 Tax=Bradyrhizobium sp. U531 TaxID=3053458 RepID=UPI003F421B52